MRDRMKNAWRYFMLATVLLMGVMTGPAWAVDGVIEINQARAMKGGVSPGDEPGFPVTISQPGSYRLTGNLTVPDANTTAIQISADNVTIDLNGFAVIGPGGRGSGVGVSSVLSVTPFITHYVAVVNGIIRGMGSYGVTLGNGSRVEHLRVLENGAHGISVRFGSTVTANVVSDNAGIGIYAWNASTISGNTVSFNAMTGIYAPSASTIVANVVHTNGGEGISAPYGSNVVRNAVQRNTRFGLNLDPGSGYAHNVLGDNNGGDANPQVSGGIQIGPNVCGSALCP